MTTPNQDPQRSVPPAADAQQPPTPPGQPPQAPGPGTPALGQGSIPVAQIPGYPNVGPPIPGVPVPNQPTQHPPQPIVPHQPVVPNQPVIPQAPIPNQPVVPNQPVMPGFTPPQPVIPNQPVTPVHPQSGQPAVPNQPLVNRPLTPVKPNAPSGTPGTPPHTGSVRHGTAAKPNAAQPPAAPPQTPAPTQDQSKAQPTGQVSAAKQQNKPAEVKLESKPRQTSRPQTQPRKPSVQQTPKPSSSAKHQAGSPAANRPLSPNRPQPVDKSRPIPIEKPTSALDTYDDEDLKDEVAQKIVRSVPSWLVSAVIHMVLLIILGLLTRPYFREEPLDIEVVEYGEEVGEQLLDDTLELTTDAPDDVSRELISFDAIEVDSPLAATVELSDVLESIREVNTVELPSLGHALAGREEGAKQGLLGKYGGNASTEAAVLRGLEWLARNQLKDGSWSLLKPFSGHSANMENQTAATAMALLAFLGAGHTHQSGEFRANVVKGKTALLRLQGREGDFAAGDNPHWTLYAQAQATIALCELYGMTKDQDMRESAQRAVEYCISIQSPEGGWKYTPGSGADMSVTGWYVMALQSAKMAGLDVSQETLDNISSFIDSVAHNNGTRYAYMAIGYEPTLAMTAEALLCRQYLGWSRDDPRLISGADYINQNLIPTTDDDWIDKKDVYYWYYATQVMHHMEGEHWKRWNNVMRQEIPTRQVSRGAEKGSWDNDYDTSGVKAGRLYTTCMCIYMLEVYYRHLPIYQYRGN